MDAKSTPQEGSIEREFTGIFETPNAGLGPYEAIFPIDVHFPRLGAVLPYPSFPDVAVFRFGIDDPSVEYRLPLKFTPWGVFAVSWGLTLSLTSAIGGEAPG